MKIIYVYKDEGVGGLSYRALLHFLKKCPALSSFDIKPIDAKSVIFKDWETNCELIAFPGGRDIPYHEKLKGKGTQKIRQFVECGGKYLGICAGAYFAAKSIEFEKGKEHEVIAQRELGFFPGCAKGAVYHQLPFSYLEHESAQIAYIESVYGDFNSYYNGGCYFQEADKFHKNVTVVANYPEVGDKASILLCNYGSGKALLSGTHFEVEHTMCRKHPKLFDALKNGQEKRQNISEKLIEALIAQSGI